MRSLRTGGLKSSPSVAQGKIELALEKVIAGSLDGGSGSNDELTAALSTHLRKITALDPYLGKQMVGGDGFEPPTPAL